MAAQPQRPKANRRPRPYDVPISKKTASKNPSSPTTRPLKTPKKLGSFVLRSHSGWNCRTSRTIIQPSAPAKRSLSQPRPHQAEPISWTNQKEPPPIQCKPSLSSPSFNWPRRPRRRCPLSRPRRQPHPPLQDSAQDTSLPPWSRALQLMTLLVCRINQINFSYYMQYLVLYNNKIITYCSCLFIELRYNLYQVFNSNANFLSNVKFTK